MIRNTAVDKQARQQRLAAKTPDSQFCRAIEAGANIPPFVSESILQVAREVYRLDPNDLDKQLDLGQVKLLVVAADEPAGKPLERCQKVPVLLTLDAGQDDFQLRVQQGLEGLRRARLLRMTLEARDQGGLLTYEDLAYRLLNCSERTIVRDIRALRKRHLEVPHARATTGHRSGPNSSGSGRASVLARPRSRGNRPPALPYFAVD
jgi:Protein of unknown function (DUF1670)